MGCNYEDPFLTEEEAKNLSKERFDLALIIDNDIYYQDSIDRKPVQLTFDAENKTDVKISWDSNRIAYFDADHVPIVLNRSNNDQYAIPINSNILQMDWIDSSSLYLFNGHNFLFHGNQYSAPELTIPDSITNWYGNQTYERLNPHIVSATINNKGDYAYIVEFWSSSNGGENQALILNSGNKSHTIYYRGSLDHMSEVNFNGENDFTIEFYSRYGDNKYIQIKNISSLLSTTSLDSWQDTKYYSIRLEKRGIYISQNSSTYSDERTIKIEDVGTLENDYEYLITSKYGVYMDMK